MGKSIVLVLSAVLSTTAFAQDNTAASSSSASASKATVAAPAQATSTATIAAPAAERKLHVEAYTKTRMMEDAIEKNDSSSHNESFLGLNYKLDNGNKVGVRQLFVLDVGANGDRSAPKMENTYVYLSQPDIVKLSDSLSISTTTRLYAPTGETARFYSKQVGALRNYLNLSQKLGKWELTANLLSQWYANTRDYTLKTNSSGGHDANNEFYIVPYAEASYSITEAISITPGVGLENVYKRAGNAEHILDMYTTLSWQAVKELSINLTYESDSATTDNENGKMAFGRGSESYGLLELVANL
jgi:hypothetical protein